MRPRCPALADALNHHWPGRSACACAIAGARGPSLACPERAKVSENLARARGRGGGAPCDGCRGRGGEARARWGWQGRRVSFGAQPGAGTGWPPCRVPRAGSVIRSGGVVGYHMIISSRPPFLGGAARCSRRGYSVFREERFVCFGGIITKRRIGGDLAVGWLLSIRRANGSFGTNNFSCAKGSLHELEFLL